MIFLPFLIFVFPLWIPLLIILFSSCEKKRVNEAKEHGVNPDQWG